jgi:hypothetical protein
MKLRIRVENIEPGDACTIDYAGMEVEKRPFMNQPCTVIKHTKGGLILISLDSDTRKRIPIRLTEYIPLISLESVKRGRAGRAPSHYDCPPNSLDPAFLANTVVQGTRKLVCLHSMNLEDEMVKLLKDNITAK